MKKIVFPGIALIGVSYAFARFSFGLFLPGISATFKLTDSASGFIGSMGYFAYCVALLTSSLLIRKGGQHLTVRLAGISAVLGMIGIALSSNAFVLGLSVFLAGLSTGWASPAFGTVTANELEKSDQNRGNTWINSGTSFGIILSGPIALLFTEYWRISYALFAFIGIVVLIWNAKVIPGRKEKISGISLWKPMNLWKIGGRLIFASFLIGISSSIYWTFSRSFIMLGHDIPYTEATWFWIVMGAFGIVGGLAGGIINRVGMQWAYGGGTFLMAIAVALLTIPNLSISFLSGILFGTTYIFLTGVFIVWGTVLFAENPLLALAFHFYFLVWVNLLGLPSQEVLFRFLHIPQPSLFFPLLGC